MMMNVTQNSRRGRSQSTTAIRAKVEQLTQMDPTSLARGLRIRHRHCMSHPEMADLAADLWCTRVRLQMAWGPPKRADLLRRGQTTVLVARTATITGTITAVVLPDTVIATVKVPGGTIRTIGPWILPALIATQSLPRHTARQVQTTLCP